MSSHEQIAAEIMMLVLSEAASILPASIRTTLLTASRDDGHYHAPLRVVVVGGFKRGKSSLINRLIDSDVLPTSVVPETSCVMRISYAKEEYAEIRFSNGKTQRVDLSSLTRESLSDHASIAESSVCETLIGLPIEMLREVEFIDTPGLNEAFLNFDDDVTRSLSQADCVLCTISATEPLSLEELELLESITRFPARPATIVALTMTDRISRSDAVELVAANVLERTRSAFPEAIICPISSRSIADEGIIRLRSFIQRIISFRTKVYEIKSLRALGTGIANAIAQTDQTKPSSNATFEDQSTRDNSKSIEEAAELRSQLSLVIRECRLEAIEWTRHFVQRIDRELFANLSQFEPIEIQRRLHYFLVQVFGEAINCCLREHLPRIRRVLSDLVSIDCVDFLNDEAVYPHHDFGVGLGEWVSMDGAAFGGSLATSVVDGVAPIWSHWVRTSSNLLQMALGLRRNRAADETVRSEIRQIRASTGEMSDFLARALGEIYSRIESDIIAACEKRIEERKESQLIEDQLSKYAYQSSEANLKVTTELIERLGALKLELDRLASQVVRDLDDVLREYEEKP